jgi:hypothetical protein
MAGAGAKRERGLINAPGRTTFASPFCLASDRQPSRDRMSGRVNSALMQQKAQKGSILAASNQMISNLVEKESQLCERERGAVSAATAASGAGAVGPSEE